MKIKLKKVILSNFLNYPKDKETIDFDDGLVGILGPNGAGKSTIMDAITFCLYGRDSKNLRNKIIGYEGYVGVIFEVDKDTVRFMVRNSSTGKITRNFKINDQEWSKDIKKEHYDILVETYVGLNYKGFVNSWFIRQNEMQIFGAATKSERLEIFKNLFDMSIFDKCMESAKARLNEMENKLEVSKTDLIHFKENLEKYKELTAQKSIKELEQDLAVINSSLQRSTDEQTKIKDEIKKMDKQLEEYFSLNSIEGSLKSEIRDIEFELKSLGENEQLESEKEKISQRVLELEKIKQAIEEKVKDVDKIEEKVKKMGEEILRVNGVKSSLGSLNVKEIEAKDDYELRVAEISSKKDKLKTKIDVIKDKKIIPFYEGKENAVRLGECNVILKYDKLLVNGENVDKIKEKLSEVKEKYDNFTPESSNLQMLIDQEKVFSDEINKENIKYKEKLDNIKNQIKEKEEQIKDVDEDKLKSNISKLSEIQKKHKDANEEILKCQVKVKDIEVSQKEYQTKKKILEQKTKEHNDVKQKIQPLLNVKDESELLNKKFESTTKTCDTLKLEQDRVKNKINTLKVVNIEETENSIKMKNQEVKEFERKVKIFTILKKFFNKKGIFANVLNEILPDIENYAAEHTNVLTEGKLTDLIIKNNDGIEIGLQRYGTELEYENLSGGEKVVINIAIHFAICQVIAEMTNVEVSSIFIDEGDLSALDTEGVLDRFMQRLEYMQKRFDSIIIISHITELKKYFTKKYKVSLDGNLKSHIEEWE